MNTEPLSINQVTEMVRYASKSIHQLVPFGLDIQATGGEEAIEHLVTQINDLKQTNNQTELALHVHVRLSWEEEDELSESLKTSKKRLEEILDRNLPMDTYEQLGWRF